MLPIGSQTAIRLGNACDRILSNNELAVLDWMMPSLSGIEVCQRMQASQHPARVLMLTAKDTMDDRVQGLDARADDYLVKPFRMPELLARIRSIQRRLDSQREPNTLMLGSALSTRITGSNRSTDRATDPTCPRFINAISARFSSRAITTRTMLLK
jgi:DNA-binding response OmpR family regulator